MNASHTAERVWLVPSFPSEGVARPHPPLIETLEPRRLLSAGDIDPTWGVGGTVTIATPDADRLTSFQVNTIGQAPGGKFIVSGYVVHPTDETGIGTPFLARLDSAGHLDPTFGG